MDIACVWLVIIFMKLFTKQKRAVVPMKTSIPKWRECGSAARIQRRFQRDIVFAHPYKPHAKPICSTSRCDFGSESFTVKKNVPPAIRFLRRAIGFLFVVWVLEKEWFVV